LQAGGQFDHQAGLCDLHGRVGGVCSARVLAWSVLRRMHRVLVSFVFVSLSQFGRPRGRQHSATVCVLEAGTSAATPVPSAERVCSPVPTHHRFAVVALLSLRCHLPSVAPFSRSRCSRSSGARRGSQEHPVGSGASVGFGVRVLVRDARRIMCTSTARALELGAA
jgi:hypothetical protein